MMKYLQPYNIFERKTFRKLDVQEFLNTIKSIKKSDLKYYFVSFRGGEYTTLINPNNIFGTPTGIYTYPIEAFYKPLMEVQKTYHLHNDFRKVRLLFQYTGDKPPTDIYLYKIKSKILNDNILTSYTTEQQLLKFMMKNFYGKNPKLDLFIDDYKSMNTDESWDFTKDNREKLFWIIKNNYNKDWKGNTFTGAFYYTLLIIFGNVKMRSFCYKNKLLGFLDLAPFKYSYDVATDGKGGFETKSYHWTGSKTIPFIYEDEPTQAVFFGSHTMFDDIETYDIDRKPYKFNVDELIDDSNTPNMIFHKKDNKTVYNTTNINKPNKTVISKDTVNRQQLKVKNVTIDGISRRVIAIKFSSNDYDITNIQPFKDVDYIALYSTPKFKTEILELVKVKDKKLELKVRSLNKTLIPIVVNKDYGIRELLLVIQDKEISNLEKFKMKNLETLKIVFSRPTLLPKFWKMQKTIFKNNPKLELIIIVDGDDINDHISVNYREDNI